MESPLGAVLGIWGGAIGVRGEKHLVSYLVPVVTFTVSSTNNTENLGKVWTSSLIIFSPEENNRDISVHFSNLKDIYLVNYFMRTCVYLDE